MKVSRVSASGVVAIVDKLLGSGRPVLSSRSFSSSACSCADSSSLAASAFAGGLLVGELLGELSDLLAGQRCGPLASAGSNTDFIGTASGFAE